ncbi:hypothetical protein ANN_09628 [Periplaneta americana]|uniref:Histone-lysine N-methyltransferase SETMAR n=1 Tax=Periplaneta americana TaxID=6978 RepID=A0ABQ8TNB2_PERAM|nr:hypothetical protein ANN_09628 [Periplaneta americana]
MDLREVGYGGRDWINLAQDRDRWRAHVRAAMNLRVPKKPFRSVEACPTGSIRVLNITPKIQNKKIELSDVKKDSKAAIPFMPLQDNNIALPIPRGIHIASSKQISKLVLSSTADKLVSVLLPYERTMGKGMSPTEIKSSMGESAPAFSTVKNGRNYLNMVESVEDDPRSGRHPVTATSEEIVEKIHDKVLNDRRMKVQEISEVLYYIPETKQKSKQWKHSDSPPPQKAKAEEVMASVFWDSKGIIMIEKGRTISLRIILLFKSPTVTEGKNSREEAKCGQEVLLHHDNAPAHTSAIAIAKLHELRFELLPHTHPTPLTTSRTLRLSFPKAQNSLDWEEIFVKGRGYRNRSRGICVQGGYSSIAASMSQVHEF